MSTTIKNIITHKRASLRGFFSLLAAPLAMAAGVNAAAETRKQRLRKNVPAVLLPKAWRWHEPHGFVPGRAVPPGATTIYVAGQASTDNDGNPIHANDMDAQLLKSIDNVERVLAEGGGTLANVVKVTYYVVDLQRFFQSMPTLTKRLTERGCRPTSTLVEVKALFHPDILFEVEAIASIDHAAA